MQDESERCRLMGDLEKMQVENAQVSAKLDNQVKKLALMEESMDEKDSNLVEMTDKYHAISRNALMKLRLS